jgi:hypothetical protein
LDERYAEGSFETLRGAPARFRLDVHDALAYSYVWVYAQWGSVAKALDWLETAYRVRDSDLEQLKTDPLVDPLRREPRFQAIERALKFPH